MRRTILLSVFLLAACTTEEPGKPTPGGEATTPPGTAPTTSVPPRPSSIALNDVDPCKLLTDAQLTELKVNRVRPTTSDSETYRGMKGCAFEASRAEPFFDYTALLVTTEGIAPWLSGERNVDAKASTVAGFPAATFHFAGASGTDSFECVTAVDVADGQHLQIEFELGTQDAFDQDQMCQMSEHAAGLAMATLQSLK